MFKENGHPLLNAHFYSSKRRLSISYLNNDVLVRVIFDLLYAAVLIAWLKNPVVVFLGPSFRSLHPLCFQKVCNLGVAANRNFCDKLSFFIYGHAQVADKYVAVVGVFPTANDSLISFFNIHISQNYMISSFKNRVRVGNTDLHDTNVSVSSIQAFPWLKRKCRILCLPYIL